MDPALQTFAQAAPDCILSLTTTALTPAAKEELQHLADHRHRQLITRASLPQPAYVAQMEETGQRL